MILATLVIAAAAPAPAVTLNWHNVRPMPRPAGGLAAAADTGYVFISGGYDGSYQWSAYSAQLLTPSPGLNTWRHITALPAPLYGHVMVSALGSLYVIGGTTNGRDTGAQKAVYRTRLMPGGKTGHWATAGSLPARLYGHGAVAAGDTLYVAGGYVPDQGYSAAVYSIRLGQHGFVGKWRMLPHLPQPRFGVTLVAGRGYLFAVGGQTQDKVAATVYAAALKPDGALGPWHAVQSLPTALAHSGATVADNWLVVAGGTTSLLLTGSVATVYAAPIHPGGTLGAWHSLPPLAAPAAAPVLLTAEKYLYAFGGFDGKVYSSSIYRACPSFVAACSSPASKKAASTPAAKSKKKK
jgi:hypothetical protein